MEILIVEGWKRKAVCSTQKSRILNGPVQPRDKVIK